MPFGEEMLQGIERSLEELGAGKASTATLDHIPPIFHQYHCSS